MLLKATLVLLSAGLALAIGGVGAGVYLVLAGMAAFGLWFAALLFRG